MAITVKTQRTRIPLKLRDVKRSAALMLKRAGVKSAELSIVFLDPSSMRRINREYLGHDRVTDVMAFDLRNFTGTQEHKSTRAQARKFGMRRPVLLCSCAPVTIEGEICICPAEARRNAKRYGEPFRRELLRYLAHGILHLLGYDDSTASKRDRMRILEDELLSHLGTLDT